MTTFTQQEIFATLTKAGVSTRGIRLTENDGEFWLVVGNDNPDFEEGYDGDEAIQGFISEGLMVCGNIL